MLKNKGISPLISILFLIAFIYKKMAFESGSSAQQKTIEIIEWIT